MRKKVEYLGLIIIVHKQGSHTHTQGAPDDTIYLLIMSISLQALE